MKEKTILCPEFIQTILKHWHDTILSNIKLWVPLMAFKQAEPDQKLKDLQKCNLKEKK